MGYIVLGYVMFKYVVLLIGTQQIYNLNYMYSVYKLSRILQLINDFKHSEIIWHGIFIARNAA